MKNIIIAVLGLALLLFIWLWFGQKGNAENLKQRLSDLKDTLSYTDTSLRISNRKYDLLKREKDSLFMLLQTNHTLATDAPQYTIEEKAVHQLVFNVHNAWEDVFRSKRTETFLNLFMPKYTTNEVTIDTKNIPHVERHNNNDFEAHVKALANTADLKIEFGNTKFLSTFIKENIFTTTYQTRLEVKDKYKTVQESSIICYVSGEKLDGAWRVGNYSWTRYNDMEYVTSR